MAQGLRTSQWVKRAHIPAGAVTTRLATSAGHPKVLLQGKVVTGLALLEDEASGVSNYDNTRIEIVGGGHLQEATQCTNDEMSVCFEQKDEV